MIMQGEKKSANVHKLVTIGIGVFLTFFLPVIGYAEVSQLSKVDIKISLLPGMERYIDLLKYPTCLTIALLSNGIELNRLADLTLLDKNTLKYKYLRLKFISKKGPLFIYEAMVDFRIKSFIYFNIEIDASEAERGNIILRSYGPLTKIISRAQYNFIISKIQSLSDESVQNKLLLYFKELEKRENTEGGIQEIILIDGYNKIMHNNNVSLLESENPNTSIAMLYRIFLFLALAMILITLFLCCFRNKINK